MANPRKFSEKIALLNQKQAEETAAFEAIMREVSDVTSRVAGVASASNSVVASPTGCGISVESSGGGGGIMSAKSAGASPPLQQLSSATGKIATGNHLRINQLGNQFKAGGSLPNVNNNNDGCNTSNNHHRQSNNNNNNNNNNHCTITSACSSSSSSSSCPMATTTTTTITTTTTAITAKNITTVSRGNSVSVQATSCTQQIVDVNPSISCSSSSMISNVRITNVDGISNDDTANITALATAKTINNNSNNNNDDDQLHRLNQTITTDRCCCSSPSSTAVANSYSSSCSSSSSCCSSSAAGLKNHTDVTAVAVAAAAAAAASTATATTIFPATLYSVDIKTALNHPEEIQNNSMMYRTTSDRSRSVGGPMRSRPAEKRHDTSPYSGVPYLSPPPPDTWRRTNSDSALHQSVNESCQMPSSMPHRRDPHMGVMGNEHRDSHRGFMERPRSSCEMPRVPGINIYPSSQPPGQQIPIGNNTGSLPDLSNVHFPPPLQAPLDQEEHSSSTPYSNSPQTSSPTTLSPTSLQQAGRLSFSQDHSPAHAQNHLSVPVNSRFLHTCKGVALDNSTSTSQQDLHSYTQPPPPAHSPQHFIYQPPHSPVPPPSPKSSQSHQPVNSLGSYRTPQTVNRPSPQSSPSLTVRSPLSYSNNPSAPPSPTGHLGQPNFTTNSLDQNNYLPDQNQAAALQQHFEQFSMDWAHLVQQLMESGCAWTTQLEMDSPVAPTSGTYISSPSHNSYTQSEMINVGGEMGGGDAGYFSTSPQLAYQPRTPTSSQQLTPQTPNTPTIILTDFSGNHGLSSSEYVKDYHGTEMTSDFDQNLFPSDDALRQGLDPIDFGDLQMLTDPDMVIDPTAEDHFRLDRL